MNYYNEWDSFAAEWLKQLIKDGLIPDGEVDSRSIADVEPSDLKGFTQCHFFAGIGGWSRALQLAGWSPDRPVWTGSPPCQSFSTAGKGKGKDDERHLWPVFFNLIRECQPPTVFGEQVAAAIRYGWLDDLQIDFEEEGYASAAVVLPAGGVGAYHKRDRLFFTAKRMANSTAQRQHSEAHLSELEREGRGEHESVEPRVTALANSDNIGHERNTETRREAQRGTEHPGGVSMANTDQLGQPRPRQVQQPGDTAQNREGEVNRAFNASGISSAVAYPGGTGLQGGEWIGKTGEEGASFGYGSERSSSSSVGNSEHDGSHGAEIGRSSAAPSDNHAQGEDVSCESTGASRPEITGDLCLWDNPQIIYCRDGKYRPIPTQPALFPLANGIPNRVGILRGAGNAIVPQAAAEIIKAYLYD